MDKGGLSFTSEAWDEYLEWLTVDRKIFDRICLLIKDIQRNGLMKGIGKPEVLGNRNKVYSRRINEYHRLVYAADENRRLRILSCKGHYDD
jgi:toxin YoeB